MKRLRAKHLGLLLLFASTAPASEPAAEAEPQPTPPKKRRWVYSESAVLDHQGPSIAVQPTEKKATLDTSRDGFKKQMLRTEATGVSLMPAPPRRRADPKKKENWLTPALLEKEAESLKNNLFPESTNFWNILRESRAETKAVRGSTQIEGLRDFSFLSDRIEPLQKDLFGSGQNKQPLIQTGLPDPLNLKGSTVPARDPGLSTLERFQPTWLPNLRIGLPSRRKTAAPKSMLSPASPLSGTLPGLIRPQKSTALSPKSTLPRLETYKSPMQKLRESALKKDPFADDPDPIRSSIWD